MELATACEAEAELLSDQTQEATSCIELAEATSSEYNETVGPPFEPLVVLMSMYNGGSTN